MTTLFDKLFGTLPAYLVVSYDGHNQEEAEQEGRNLQHELRQYGLRCHIYEINQDIPEDTDFLFCTHFTPGPLPDLRYFLLTYKDDDQRPGRIQEYTKKVPGCIHAGMTRSGLTRSVLHEQLIVAWACK
jgi:hypothetical protein